MKKILVILGIVLVSGGVFTFGMHFKYLTQRFYKPRVLAVVNGKEILETELKREMRFLQVSENMAFSDITREDVLDRMINDQLISKEAERLQVAVDDATVDNYLKTFWDGSAVDERDRILKNQQLSPDDWRALVRKRLLIEATIKKAVEDNIRIGEDEIEEYYWAHVLQFYRQDRVKARQIVVETKEQAVALKQRVDQGESFQTLAKQYSRGPEKDEGGDLGWVEKADLPQAFSNILFQMQPKQYNGPVATQYGYHIFYVEERERGGKISLDEAKKKIEDELRLEKGDQAFRVWLENLRAQASIKIKNRQGVD